MLQIQIITPEEIVFKEEADQVTVPTATGQITILPNHIGLFTKIEPGELIVKKGNTVHSLAITGGFLEVAKNQVTLLADYAVRAEKIDVEKALQAQKRAEQLKKQAGEKMSERDLALAESQMQRALLELKIGTKRQRHRDPRNVS